MAEQLSLQINVGGNVDASLGSLKKQLREAQAEVGALADKFGATSNQAIEAAKRAAQLKDKIGDAKALTDAFNPDQKFKALTSSLAGVAGGFAAVQGAIGLFGVESKEVEKQLLKVQAAMAISQGLAQIGDSIDAFRNLGGVIKDTVVKAFGSLKAAIISTGVGALVIALGLLVANFAEVKKFVLNLFPGLEKLGNFFSKITNAVTDFVGVTSEASRELDKLKVTTAKSNEEITNKIKLLTAQGGKEKEIYALSLQLAENDLQVFRKTIGAKGELTDEEAKKFRELKNEKNILGAEETKRIEENDAKQVESDKKKNDEILKQKEDARLKALEIEQKRRDDVNGVEDEIQKTKNEIALVGLSKLDAEKLKLQQELDENLIKYKDNLDAKQKAYILYDAQIKLLNANTAIEEQAAEVKKTETFYTNLINKGIAQTVSLTKEQDIKEKKSAADDALNKAKAKTQEELAGQTLDIIGGFVDKNSVAGKAIAISQAIMNTYQGATKAIAQGGVFGPIAAAATIAAGLISVKKIISTRVPSAKGGGDIGGGGGVSISAAAPITMEGQPTQTTNISQSSINALGNQALRAYVIETDVTNSQQRIAAIQQRARFN